MNFKFVLVLLFLSISGSVHALTVEGPKRWFCAANCQFFDVYSHDHIKDVDRDEQEMKTSWGGGWKRVNIDSEVFENPHDAYDDLKLKCQNLALEAFQTSLILQEKKVDLSYTRYVDQESFLTEYPWLVYSQNVDGHKSFSLAEACIGY